MKVKAFKADLHVHTSASDGTYNPKEIVREAEAVGLKAVGITDHDTLDGIKPALEEAAGRSIEVIPGIELSTIWEDQEVHLLGYYINYELDWLKDILIQIKGERQKRIEKIIARLHNLNYKIDKNKITAMFEKSTVGRPHIAQALVEKGYVNNISEAFEVLLGQGRPAYVPRKSLSVHEALKIIHRAEGLAVLAHPGLLKNDRILYYLIEEGLDGVEVFHPEHEQKICDYYWRLVKEYKLFATGGSDFHGPGVKRVSLGCCAISLELFQIFKNKAINLKSYND